MLDLSRQKMREKALGQFKHLRTCVLARELCLLVRANRVTFDVKDAHNCCVLIAKLCQEAGCTEPSELCSNAAEAVLTSEEKYLELCEQSCGKCGESRKPKEPRRAENRYYVA
ncbi:MAG: hypothetical protein JSV12_01400 [Candidatus Bathyarchaeota archaeon]|nr:MAG: hypothetical protein JSV12_01400 [Candidatus Bathyarchaeota archaeon]